MIPTTFNGESIFLLPFWPEWPVRGRFSHVVSEGRGITGRESRRPLSDTVRVSLSFSVVCMDAAVVRLIGGLREWKDERVAVPFWPGAILRDQFATRHFSSGVYLALSSDDQQWQLFSATPPEWMEVDDWIVPLLLGSISRRSSPSMLSAVSCRFAVDFEEDSDSDLALDVTQWAWESGPLPSDSWTTPPAVFPFELAFERPRSGAAVEVESERLGPGRLKASTFYDQTPHRNGEATAFADTVDESAGIVRFFMDHGAGSPWWFAQDFLAAKLAADGSAGGVSLTVEDPHAVKAGDWIRLNEDAGASAASVKVSSVASTTLTLASPLARTWDRERTAVNPLALVVFDRTQITVNWQNPEVAVAAFSVREVPDEYVPAADETIGTTLGRLLGAAVLVSITDGVDIVRLTNFERAIQTSEGFTFEPIPMQVGSVRRGVAPDRDETTVEVDLANASADGLLARIASMRTDRPVRVTISRITTETT